MTSSVQSGLVGAIDHTENADIPVPMKQQHASDLLGSAEGVQQMIQPKNTLAAPTRSSPWLVANKLEQKYEYLNVLGAGAHGTVYKARRRDTKDEFVAIKKIRISEELAEVLGPGVPTQVIREVVCLREFKHPNIVRLLDVHINGPQEYSLVFEYVQADLHTLLKKFRENKLQLPMEQVKMYASALLNGIFACHQRLILHRDLKPQNILIGPTGLKIADFGLARAFTFPIRNYTLEVITLWYRAIEILLGAQSYGAEVDMWSAGAIISEMATGSPLFPGDSAIGTIFKIFQVVGTPSESDWPEISELTNWTPTFPQWSATGLQCIQDVRHDLGQHGMGLLRGLLTVDPRHRLTARRAKNSAFMQATPDAL